MDDQDFDKIFSDRLGEEQSFDFRESDWDEMAEQISPGPASGIRWWKWLFSFLLLTFGAVIYCLNADLKEAQSEIHTLKENIEHQETTSKIVEKVDTHYQSITVIAYDTVYQKVVLEEQQRLLKSNDEPKSVESIHSSIKGFNSSSTVYATEKSNAADAKESLLEKRVGSDVAILDNKIVDKQLSLNSKRFEAAALISDLMLNPVKLKTKKIKQPFYLYNITTSLRKMKVSNQLSIGLTNAWGIVDAKSNNFYQRNDKTSKVLMDIGLRAEWSFSKRWRGFATLSVNQIYLRTSDLGASFESVLEPNPDGVITGVKVRQRATHYELGLKYLIVKNKKWIPYGGLSITAQSNLNHQFKIDYSYSYQSPDTKRETLKNADFKLNHMTYFWGYEYQFSDRFSWQIEQWYRFQIKWSEEQMYSSFGIRNTVLYHF